MAALLELTLIERYNALLEGQTLVCDDVYRSPPLSPISYAAHHPPSPRLGSMPIVLIGGMLLVQVVGSGNIVCDDNIEIFWQLPNRPSHQIGTCWAL